MVSGMGEMLQAKQIQQKPNATNNAQVGRREFYIDWALTVLMGHAQVYTEICIPRIWGKFKCPRNVLTTDKNYW